MVCEKEGESVSGQQNRNIPSLKQFKVRQKKTKGGEAQNYW